MTHLSKSFPSKAKKVLAQAMTLQSNLSYIKTFLCGC